MDNKLTINNKEEFEKFAERITRKAFMEDYLIDTTGRCEYGIYENGKLIVSCPKYIELENCEECSNCYVCWKNAVKGIYFKDDIRNVELMNNIEKNSIKVKEITTYDYNREYTLQEVFEFPYTAEFTCSNNDYKVRVRILTLEACSQGENNWDECSITYNWLHAKYKLVSLEKKVTFLELLESDSNSKCKVEYELIDDLEAQGLNEYMYFHAYMMNLFQCKELDSNDIKDIIKTGQWYLKECN